MSEASEKLKAPFDEFEAHATRLGVDAQHVSGVQGRMYKAGRALLAERTWRPMDSAPRDGTPVLLYWPELRGTLGTNVIQAQWNLLADGWMSNGWQIHLGPGIYAPERWMPIPPPPEPV